MSDERQLRTPPMPRRLGRYELVHELGSGGMAEVFLAKASGPANFHKWFAIKRIHPHLAKDPRFVDMFLDEARIAAAVHHPNVAQVFDLGEQDGEPFLAMEYMHGEHLGLVAARATKKWGRIPFALAARIVASAANGLHHAHETKDRKGRPLELVHRDVSPQNIFITFEGQVKMTDFGIAKAAGRLTHTRTGSMKGKVAYMSPEQALGHAVDRRADIFALGVVLWEISTGRRLFKSATDAQALMRITSGNTPTPSSMREGYPPKLERIVMKALENEPADRYATAEEMARDLERFIAAHAKPIGGSEMASMMAALCADRFAFKEQLLLTDMTVSELGEEFSVEIASAIEGPEPSHSAIRTVVAARPTGMSSRTKALWLLALLAGLSLLAWGLFQAQPFGSLTTPSNPSNPSNQTRTNVQIATRPSGARVVLDGVALDGFTPLWVTSLSSGRHTVVLDLEGHTPLERTFDVQPRSTELTLDYSLSRPEPQAIADEDSEPDVNVTVPQVLGAGVRDPGETDEVPDPDADMRHTSNASQTEANGLSGPTVPHNMRRTPPSMQRAEAENAYLSVRALPWMSVRINGGPARNTPIARLPVPAGRVVLTYQVQGEGPVLRHVVRLTSGENQIVQLRNR